MNTNVFPEWLQQRKRLLLVSLLIFLLFFTYWYFSLGSIASFFAAYLWAVDRAEKELGLNPFLIKGILIPLVALFVYSLNLSFNLTKQWKRNLGRFLLIVIFSVTSFALYYYTEQIYLSDELFNPYTGQPLKRYWKSGLDVEYFPLTTRFHPKTGDKLPIVDKDIVKQRSSDLQLIITAEEKANKTLENAEEKANNIIDQANLQAEQTFNELNDDKQHLVRIKISSKETWQDTKIPMTRGDWVDISASGYVSPNGGERFDPNGADNRWQSYNIIPGGHCALIAQISPGGEPFLVGKNYRFIADRTGVLLLGVNDNDTGNNRGAFFVTVRFLK